MNRLSLLDNGIDSLKKGTEYLKKYLKDKNVDELRNEIIDIVKNFRDIKEYYNMKINPESEEEILKKYMKI